MPEVDFSAAGYYPVLQCAFPDQLGYRNLSSDDKDSLIPIFEIGQRTYDDADLSGPIGEIEKSVEHRPFILDLCKDPCPPAFVPRRLTEGERARVEAQTKTQQSFNTQLAALLNPADGFAAWRELCGTLPNCIPVLQFSDPATQFRSILRQGAMLARKGPISVRITDGIDPSIVSAVAQLFAVLETASALLILVDCGQGRTRTAERADFARRTIASILSEVEAQQRPEVRAVCLSSSYPNADHDGLKEIRSADRAIWSDACSAFPFIYGDYAAVYRRRNSTMFVPGDWRATVVYPLDRAWLIYRDDNAKDPDGWQRGAAAVVAHDRYNPTQACWGGELIARAAKGDFDDARSNRFWYAAKTNLHLHRQIALAGSPPYME